MATRILFAAVLITAVLTPSCNFDHAQQIATFGPDRIAIDEVQGPTAAWTPGGSYQVQGRYKLRTRESALLAAFVPTTPGGRLPVLPAQSVLTIPKGEGRFQLAFQIPDDYISRPERLPQVTMAATSGDAFLTMGLAR